MAFHRNPQLIPELFLVHGFGPPPAVTRASAWLWVGRPASCLPCVTSAPSSDSLSLRLRPTNET